MSKCILLKGGGGADLDVITAESGDVLDGKVIVDKEGNPLTGSLTLTGSATASQVLNGATFYNTNAKTKATGTMPNNGAVTPDALSAGGSYTIPLGYHNGNGKVTVKSLADLTASGDATAAQILSGKKAYVDGTLITGSMTDRGAQTKNITPSASAQSYTIPAGYHNGSGKVSVPAVSNLSAANIKKGVVVGGVTGTWEGWVPTATDLYLRGNNIKGWVSSHSSITFESGAIYIRNSSFKKISISTSIDYTKYTKFNIELQVLENSFRYLYTNLYLMSSATGSIYLSDFQYTKTKNSTVILSHNISNINQTIPYTQIIFGNTSSTTDHSGGSIGHAQVYRIWLS